MQCSPLSEPNSDYFFFVSIYIWYFIVLRKDLSDSAENWMRRNKRHQLILCAHLIVYLTIAGEEKKRVFVCV